ncbi:MAG: flagellar export protein FliJ [Pseudomonadota bacterium]|jgi:flagellar FliJ protein
MPRRFTLQPLLDLAESRSEKAAKALAALKARWQEAEEKLRQLQQYRESYRERLRQTSGAGMSATAWRDYQAFMNKLDAAIRQQQEEVVRCEDQWKAGQREWLAHRRDVKAFDTLSQRHRRSEAKRAEKAEQREQDEFARKIFERGRPTGEDE